MVGSDVESQAEQALSNIKNLAQDNGLSLRDAIKCVLYLTDMNDFTKVNNIYATYFTSDWPARTCVAIKELPAGAKFEIETIFFRPSNSFV